MNNNTDIERGQKIRSDKNFDVRISRCLGLARGKAIRKITNRPVYAEDVMKSDGPFYCPICLCEAIIRKCSERIDHFAHQARHSPIIRQKDKDLHNTCRDQILGYLRITFPDGKWAAEREIPANKNKGYNKVIPDISGRIGDIPVAIEVQASAYTIKRISDKITEYQKRNPKVAVLYIIPLYEELGNQPFRPRLYEKYIHSMYYGRVYYWTVNTGTLLQPIHFSPAKRWIEETIWFDTEIEQERKEGGFWLTYRTIKIPNYGQKVDIAKDFTQVIREPFIPKNERKAIPKCTVYKDSSKDWWDKQEYKDLDKQFSVFRDNYYPEFIKEYDYMDDYDDESCE